MRFSAAYLATLVISALPAAFAGIPHVEAGYAAIPRRHNEVANRARSDVAKYEFTNIRATWYGAGMTACGKVYQSSDFIVALGQETFGWSYPSKYCGRGITIEYNGKTAHATIVDSCVACSLHSPWALDFTEGLFDYFAGDPGIGVISVNWSFDSWEPPAPPKPTTTKHSTTHHTTSTRHTTSTHHTTTTHHTTPTSTSAASPTSTQVLPTGNLASLEEFVLNLDNLLNAAAAK